MPLLPSGNTLAVDGARHSYAHAKEAIVEDLRFEVGLHVDPSKRICFA